MAFGPTQLSQRLVDIVGMSKNNLALSDVETRRLALAARQQSSSGRHDVTFNNVGVFFIQGLDSDGNVVGNFLYFAKGTGAGSESGSLLKQLRLSE